MGTKSVEEYYAQFIELLRFVPEVASDEQRKISRFEHGLTFDLQEKVGGDSYATLEAIYGKAT